MKIKKEALILAVIGIISLLIALETPVPANDLSDRDTTGVIDTTEAVTVVSMDSVHYSADSIYYDVDREIIFLTSNAQINYHNSSIKADLIIINLADNQAYTEGETWMQDQNQILVGNSASYDFETQKGLIKKGASRLDKGFYYGDEIRKIDDDIYDIDKGYFTTCEIEEPNFYIYSGKMRLFHKDKIVAKPIILYVNHFPILVLPFATFSVKTERESGILVPEPGYNSVDGKYIENIALYYAYNDYFDVVTALDWRELTGWEARLESRYIKRYNYVGNVLARFQNNIISQDATRQEWYLRAQHRHDFIDRSGLDANLEFVSSRTIWEGSADIDERLSERVTSTVAYRKPLKSTTLNAGATYTDNLSEDTKQIVLPTFSYSLPSKPFYEIFQSGERRVTDKWWQDFYYSYSLRGVHFGDVKKPNPTFAEVFYKNVRDEDDNYLAQHNAGIRHSLGLSYNKTFRGWLNFSQSLNGSEVWFDRDREGNSLVRGFEYNTSSRLSHSLYGIANYRNFPITTVRHIMTPSLSFNYSPSYRDRLRYYPTPEAASPQSIYYSFSGIGLSTAPKRRNLSFSLNHKWSLKYLDSKTDREIPLNDFLTFSSTIGYDLEKDEKPFTEISHSANVRPPLINIGTISINYNTNISARQDAYDFDILNWRIGNNLRISGQAYYRDYFPQQKNLFFTGAAFQPVEQPASLLGDAFPYEDDLNLFRDPSLITDEELLFGDLFPESIPIPDDVPSLTRDLSHLTERFPWNLTLSHDYSRVVKTRFTTQNLRSSTSFKVTKNWSVNYSNYYNLERKELISQSLSVDRDLICWRIAFTWSKQGDYWNYRILFHNIKLPDVMRIRRTEYYRG